MTLVKWTIEVQINLLIISAAGFAYVGWLKSNLVPSLIDVSQLICWRLIIIPYLEEGAGDWLGLERVAEGKNFLFLPVVRYISSVFAIWELTWIDAFENGGLCSVLICRYKYRGNDVIFRRCYATWDAGAVRVEFGNKLESSCSQYPIWRGVAKQSLYAAAYNVPLKRKSVASVETSSLHLQLAWARGSLR